MTTDMLIYLLGVAVMAGTILSRITALEKKVDKHNNFAGRMPVVEEQIRVINHRIEDLEREVV